MGKTTYYNKNRASSGAQGIPWNELQSLTRTLLKFCLDHGFPEDSSEMKAVAACIKSLEDEDIIAARRFYGQIYFGREGFNEWQPSIIQSEETGEYALTIFRSLCIRWQQLLGDILT